MGDSMLSAMDNGNDDCGAIMGAGKKALSMTNYVKETALLTTLSDGSSPQDYSFAVYGFTFSSSSYNLNTGRPQLNVYDDTYGDMRAVQVITVPQGAIINTNNKEIFFFGCLRPNTNKVDMKSAGFYDYADIIGNTGKQPFEVEVCSKLRLS